MALTFSKIRFKNFLSTGNSFIEFNLDQHDTTLIVGANGSGKSTLLDALSFGLFGKSYRKLNKSQLVNSIIKKNCLVEVEFSTGETNYMVRRGINPNIFEVYQDDRLLNQQANSRDYQQILEEQIIKATHKSFCQIVILGMAAFEPFMKLTMAQRREVIEDLLDLQVFTSMNIDLKERASNCNQNYSAKLAEKNTLANQLELLRHHAKVIEANREQSYEEKNNKLKFLQQEHDELVLQIRACEVEIANLMASIEDEQRSLKDLKFINNCAQSAAHKRKDARANITFFEEHDTCPTCTQAINDNLKKAKIEEFTAVHEHYRESVEKIKEKEGKIEERIREISKVKDKISDWKLELQVMKSRKVSIIKQMDDLKKDINSLSKVTELAEDVPKVEKALEDVTHECLDLEETKKIYSYASIILKDTGIKSKIIKQYVPIMNRLINKNLADFDMYVNFQLDENFNETIRSRYRDEFSYENFSQGERQRIDLAILFAWRAIAGLRNTINTNILILDEVFDSSLDSNAIEYLMNMIRIHAQTNNIFVISHKDQMNDKFERIIEFRKVRNFSQMMER